MPAETVDVLELQIRSRAEDAAQQIENLATSVADFGKNVRKYISNLNDFSAALTAIADAANKLSNTKGLGKVLEKVAPVAAAMKAKTPVAKAAAMSAQTKEAQFRRAYADVFPSRAAQKGMYPGKIVRLANDSAMVMDPRDINKRSVSALSAKMRSQYGMDRYSRPGAMNELITKVRSGAGRYEGANQAWMTQDAQAALRELAEYVVASARPENDSDLIARIRAGGNASLSLGKLDKEQLKQADMSVSSLRALLRDAGIGYSATGTGSKAEDFGRYMDKEYGTIMDLVEGLEKAYKNRNQNFIDEKGSAGGREAAIEAVEKELLSEILDIEARNERVETAPDAKAPMEALRKAYDESQQAAEPEIKQEAQQVADEIKEAIEATVRSEGATAAEAISNSEWKRFAEMERDMNRDYEGAHKLNWKEIERQNQLYDERMNGPMAADNTRAEVAGWKATEDARDEAQRMAIAYGQAKQYTEELVQALSVGTTDTKQIIEDVTGISRETKSAAASMGDFLLAEENAANKAKTIKEEIEAIKASSNNNDLLQTDINRNILMGLDPLEIAAKRQRAISQGKLEEWMDFANVQPIVDQALDRGIITEEHAQAALDAFYGIERVAEAAKHVGDAASTAREQVTQLLDALNAPVDINWASSIDRMFGIGAEVKSAEDSMSAFMQGMQGDNNMAATVRDLNPELQEFCQEAMDAGNDANGLTADLADLDGELKRKKKDAGTASEGIRGFKDGLAALWDTIKGGNLGKLAGQLFRVAKMRALRAIVKNVAAGGFKEGMNNLYGWSDALSGHFAGAMDTIATKAMYAKNSIATAFAPAIEALVPILSTVVNWIHAASNALAQFIALLTGQSSWTEATESAEKWGDAAKGAGGAAKKAAKEAKDLLADWDELNIIQSKTDDSTGGGGGGGGGSKTNYADMFKENFKFDEWTRYFEQIKNIAIAIGVAIAGWKLIDIASTFLKKIGVAEGIVDTIASKLGRALSGIVLLSISFNLAQITGKSIARNGLTLTNALTGMGSLISGALGGYFLASAINPALGIVGAVAGLTMSLVVGIKAYIDEKRAIDYENVDAYLETQISSKVFKFDVNAVVENVNTTVANATKARKDVQTQLSKVLTSVNVLKIGVNTKDSWTEIYNQVLGSDGLLNKIQTQLTEQKNVITLYYETQSRSTLEGHTPESGAAKGMKTELLANSWLSSEYTRLGKKFGECFVEGEVAAIKEGKEEQALAILNTMTEAEQAAERARSAAQLNIELQHKINGLDDEKVMEEMAEIFNEYEQNLADARQKIAEEHYVTLSSMLAELKSLGASETIIKAVEDQLAKAKAELDEGDWVIKVHAEFIEDEKKMFGEELVKRYGPQLAEYVSTLAGEGLGDAQFFNAIIDAGGYDEYVQNQLEELLRILPETAGKWLLDNGINIEDFLTDEQKALIQAGKSRFEGTGGGPMTEPIEIADGGVTEEIRDSAGAVEENTIAVTELTGALEEFAPNEPEKPEEPVIKELSETEKLVAEYFKGVQEYYKTGNPAALDNAQNKLQWGLYDINKPELYDTIVSSVMDYIGSQKDAGWMDRADTPEDLLSLISGTSFNIDAATSGMALDSTMTNLGESLTGKADEEISILDRVATRVADLITATNNLANRPVNVNLGVSSLLGDLFGRSSDAYGKATG